MTMSVAMICELNKFNSFLNDEKSHERFASLFSKAYWTYSYNGFRLSVLSRFQVAFGVSRKTCSNWTDGSTAPSLKQQIRIVNWWKNTIEEMYR